MDFYQMLADLGLVRVQMRDPVGTQPSGTVWWVGQLTAEELVCSGKATLVPLLLSKEQENESSTELPGQ